MNRLVKLLGDLPVTKDRRERLVDVRNGAIHIGSGDESRYVLLDCLAVVGVLLERLDVERKDFFGSHIGTVDTLLDQRKTEASRTVEVKMTRARVRLTRLEETLGKAAFKKATDVLEEQRWSLDSNDFVAGGGGSDVGCPECGSKARLFGELEVHEDVDHDVESLGDGRYETVVRPYSWVSFRPETFFCTVCNLQLHGNQELVEAGLPSQSFDVSSGDDFGLDFDPDEYIRAIYWEDRHSYYSPGSRCR